MFAGRRFPTRWPSALGVACTVLALSSFSTEPAQSIEPDAIGVGMVNPPLDPNRPLYFYRSPKFGAYPPTVAPDDSLTFRTGDHFIDIGSAPPWFAPKNLKLDYDLLYLRAVSLSRYWIEVVVNESPERPRSFPETAWINREAVTFRPWTEFLLDVYSVETVDPATNPLRAGPGGEFPETGSSENLQLRVLAVQGSWARVEGAEANETSLPRGWIRWREGERLVITYSLLS